MELPGQNRAENYSTAATTLMSAKIARVCSDRFGTTLRAVVLTGSLARGEGTWVRRGEGGQLLGDADIFLVFHSGTPMPANGTRAVREAIERALAEDDVVADVTLAPVYPEFLARLPRHIATFELRECGRVLWGDADVLSLVPGFSAAEICREDAWRMLANRIIEQLEAAATGEGVLSARSRYATVKLILDIATSYLVFAGLYQPAYGQRVRVLQEAARDHGADVPFPLAPFAEILEAATAYKLQATPMPYAPERLWADAARYASDLWAWQLVRLTGGSPSSATPELMKQWMRQMPWKARLRGWASAARRSRLNATLCLPWLRLVPKGSPRYLTYAVATELFFRLPEVIVQDPDAADWPGLAASLPLPHTSPVQPDTWQALARSIALNYHQLLESTTA
jgi:hypothetical protein